MAHFNCSTLQGVEVENQGGGGTAGSHWERRILGVCTYVIGADLVQQGITIHHW